MSMRPLLCTLICCTNLKTPLWMGTWENLKGQSCSQPCVANPNGNLGAICTETPMVSQEFFQDPKPHS